MKSLQERIDAIPGWYHKIELPGAATPGHFPYKREAYRFPEDLTGKRVLDVGAWDGYWSFEAVKSGAAEVVAIDNFSDTICQHKDSKITRQGWDAFDLCREALGIDPERCMRRELSVYDIRPEHFGVFDVVLLYGVLYHLRYPILALDALSQVCSDEIRVESAILDYYSPYRGGLTHGYDNAVVAEFYPSNEYADNATNWWSPTLAAMASWIGSAGFRKVKGWRLTDFPKHICECRGFCVGRKLGEP